MGARSDVVYLDFAKAFDSVPHQELLYKLRLMDIDGNLWLWFRDYLSDRFQCVCIGSCRSNLLSVLSGVPQGSILGPLLFINPQRAHAQRVIVVSCVCPSFCLSCP